MTRKGSGSESFIHPDYNKNPKTVRSSLDCHKSESWMVKVVWLITYFGNEYDICFKLMNQVCLVIHQVLIK